MRAHISVNESVIVHITKTTTHCKILFDSLYFSGVDNVHTSYLNSSTVTRISVCIQLISTATTAGVGACGVQTSSDGDITEASPGFTFIHI